MAKSITRLFDTFAEAEHAVIELERVGIAHHDISLVSHQSDIRHADFRVRGPHGDTAGDAAAKDAGVGAVVGGTIGAAGGTLAGLGLLAIPGLGPVVAAGWLASAAVAAVIGGGVAAAAGGIVGALTHAGVSRDDADVYAEGVRRGGTLLSAKVDDDQVASAEAAVDALLHVDIASRGADYREGGWERFDERAPPFSEKDVEAERRRWIVL